MSISEMEAELAYPRRTWPDRPDILAVLNLTTDDLQEAYMCGREAEPCDEQIDAGAIALMASQTNFAAGSNPTENDIIDAWNHLPENMQNMFRMRVESVLEAAQKAVEE